MGITGATHRIPQTGKRRGTVNPTARWPERLEHIATLLRADAVAVVSATPAGPDTVFSHRLAAPLDWIAVLGEDAFARAERGAFVTAIPAGRWSASASFAVVAPIEAWNGEAVLCGLRQEVPFDAVDAMAATAAARLLEMSALEGRALAETLRQSSALEERLEVMSRMGDELGRARDAGALLARATEEVARRMGAGAASIMVVEGDTLRLRASVGLPASAITGQGQRVGEGIAGWVAQSGEKMILRGRVDDARFHGVDPDSRESVIVPLREGSDVLGVLNVKRPEAVEGFADRQDLLDELASDIGRVLRAANAIGVLERERELAMAFAGLAEAVARRDMDTALERALALGHHAVALRAPTGAVIAVRADEGDDACRESALAASVKARAEASGGPGVGFARHGATYGEDEAALAQRTADTLALLGRGMATEPALGLRVHAVEDHPLMRLGVRAMLEREGFLVAATSATCAEAIGLLAETAPDVVLLDLRLPDATGSEAVARIHDASPSTPIVVFSVERTPALIRAAVRAGASGYVTKDAPIARISAAIRAAASGLVVMGPDEALAAAGTMPTGGSEPEPAAVPPPEPTNGGAEISREALTPRELELLRYMAEGYTNKEVARAMVLAEDTVKKAVQTLIAKLGAADRTHAVVVALRNHLID